MKERFLKLKNLIPKALIDLNLQINLSDGEFDLIFLTVLALIPVKLAVEALCRRDSNLFTTNAKINFMLQLLKEQHTLISEELYITLKNHTEGWHTKIENVLCYLHNYNDTKKEKEENRLTNSNMIKFRVNFLKIVQPQTYSYSEEFGTVIDDDDTAKREKELSLEQKLELAITEKNSTKQNTIQKSVS
ncbi:uncharacterized protein TNCV_134741 [Trichonephila clavipes]|nr:uncharacterized protein TNCV_134741 [Trichonephila clavipes]